MGNTSQCQSGIAILELSGLHISLDYETILVDFRKWSNSPLLVVVPLRQFLPCDNTSPGTQMSVVYGIVLGNVYVG